MKKVMFMTDWKNALDMAVSGNVIDSLLPPHVRFLSLPKLTSWSDKSVDIIWQATEDVYQGSDVIFGGYIAALVDYIAGATMLTVLANGKNFATRRLTTDFKRPLKAGEVKISAYIVQECGDNVQVNVSFYNAEQVLCAEALVDQVYI